MITRHHIFLACGGTIILYLPLAAGNLLLLPMLVAGVCVGAVLPDIQMKRPRRLTALYPVWLLVLVFRHTILRFYIRLYMSLMKIQPSDEDKRLTHSLPGLFFLTGLIGCGIILILCLFPGGPLEHYTRIFSAGIIIGMLFHFLEDICTKKGLCLMYPFSETCRIAGSIRPCNTGDFRIRQFHILTGIAVAFMVLLCCTGLCPEELKWPVSAGTLAICIILMLHQAEVRMEVPA